MAIYPPTFENLPIFEPEKFPLLDTTTQSVSPLVTEYNQLEAEVTALGANVGAIVYSVAVPIRNSNNSSTIGTGDFVYNIGLPTLVVGGIYWIIAQLTFSYGGTDNEVYFNDILAGIETTGNVLLWRSALVPRTSQGGLSTWTMNISYVFTYSVPIRITYEADLSSGGTYSLNYIADVAQSELVGMAFPANNIQIMRLQ
jgi:hypothetical protein